MGAYFPRAMTEYQLLDRKSSANKLKRRSRNSLHQYQNMIISNKMLSTFRKDGEFSLSTILYINSKEGET